MKFRVVFEGALCLGAVLAVVGGATIGGYHLLDLSPALLGKLEAAYRNVMFGFGFLSIFAVASVLLDALAAWSRRAPAAEPAPPYPVPAAAPAPSKAPSPSRLSGLYHEMKTYVDLEMWELALGKATQIVDEFPGTREAELVSKNLGELRWKAEPKFVAQGKPLSLDQQKELREKGLAQMYQHVKTYMDLEMWELARQKAITIMRNFPDAPESAELTKVFGMISKKAAEAVGEPPAVS